MTFELLNGLRDPSSADAPDASMLRQMTEAVSQHLSAITLDWIAQANLASAIVDSQFNLLWLSKKDDFEIQLSDLISFEEGAIRVSDTQLYSKICASMITQKDETAEILHFSQVILKKISVKITRVASAHYSNIFGILINISNSYQTSSNNKLQTVFKLTKTQEIILAKLINGKSTRDIAPELSVSRETVRTHIPQIYAKTGARNRESLFSICLPYLN